MPATPAWPPQSTPRLFVDQPLAEGPIRIDGPAAHYLVSVMRTKVGDPVKLFDDRTGEWLGIAASVGKRDLTLDVTEMLREREAVPDLWLCAAPLKKGRVDWLAEKACELGVARLVPVVTRRTVVDKPNTERLRAHMIEAAEQCGRTALPEVAEPVKLAEVSRSWPRKSAASPNVAASPLVKPPMSLVNLRPPRPAASKPPDKSKRTSPPSPRTSPKFARSSNKRPPVQTNKPAILNR